MKNSTSRPNWGYMKALEAYFAAQENIYAAYLFGSYARGQETEESDIDILVALKYEDNRFDYFAFWDLQADLTAICGKRVDLLSEKSISPFMLPYIEQDKQLIYERETRG